MAELITYNFNNEKDSEIDRTIYKYILESENENFEDILLKENDWQIFLHLSPLRAGLLNWYDFKNNSNILEVGAGFGALTGVLCKTGNEVTVTEKSNLRARAIVERYKNYNNLTVYVGDLKDINFERKFDYIVLTGLLELQGNGENYQEPYISYLKNLLKLLKSGGKILISLENRYGLKYFCGEIEPHTKEVFAGINQYSIQKGRGYCFDRQEIIDILKKSGVQNFKFYYPLPDYKLPQIIYSDNFLPSTEIKERMIPYYNSRSLIASELNLYSDIARNGVFNFFANSFFIECGNNIEFSKIDYVAITSDRGQKRSFITSILEKKTVKKRAVYENGKEYLMKIKENLDELFLKGINVINCKMENYEIIMPFMKEPTLANYLRNIEINDKNKVLIIFDKLWDSIISSSDVSLKINEELSEYVDDFDFGIILEKAYMELIPMNCFYIDGELIFFDQEFIKTNYPAKYVMFRALAFIHNDIEKIVSIEEMKNRYKINDDMWNLFWKIELEFFGELRNTSLYRQYYIKRDNLNRIEKNRKIMTLMSD